MDANALDAMLKMFLAEMRQWLEQASGVAKAAEACAETGNIEKAIEIVLDVEQLIFQVNTLLNAASLINQVQRR